MDLRLCVERVTGIEPAWPAWKARFPSVSFGWSQPFLPLTVPSACLCRRRGPRRPRVHSAYIGALMPRPRPSCPDGRAGSSKRSVTQDTLRTSRVFVIGGANDPHAGSVERPWSAMSPGRLSIAPSSGRRPAAAHGAALPTSCRQAGGGPGGEAGDDGAGPGQAQGAQRVSARRVRRSPAAAGSRCSPARSAGVPRWASSTGAAPPDVGAVDMPSRFKPGRVLDAVPSGYGRSRARC